MTARETDPALHRIERDAQFACVALALLALVVSGGRWDISLGVLAGGVLAGVSYRAIKTGVDELMSALTASRRPPDDAMPVVPRRLVARVVIVSVGRYALLGGIAYGMIARLGLHPVGLVVGVSSVVVAAAIESGRALGGPRNAS